jgi:hypothetical protein
MNDKPEITRITRTISLARITIVACAFFALSAPVASQSADRSLELRQRLDSLEVEKQMRKRQGKPIDDLEAATVGMRDSLLDLRLADTAPAQGQAREKGGGFSLPEIPFLSDALAFRPAGIFDWIIVGTGFVALLSGLMLVVGIVAGRKKKVAAPKKKVVSRKINLAPTGPQAAVGNGGGPQQKYGQFNDGGAKPFGAGATYGYNGRMADGGAGAARRDDGIPDNLQTLVEHLRKVAPPAQQPAAPPPPPPAPPPPPPPPSPPPPLIVNAPDEPPPPVKRHAPPAKQRGAPVNSALPGLASPEPDISGQELSEIGLSGPGFPGAPPAAGAGTQAFNDVVVAASNSGLSDTDISKRYQISVDQVRLILRMNQNRP